MRAGQGDPHEGRPADAAAHETGDVQMTMTGTPLSTYAAETFAKVAPGHDANPVASVDLEGRLGPKVAKWLRETCGAERGKPLSSVAHRIPMRAYALLTAEELCKARHSTIYSMDSSVEDAFKADPTLRLFQKISSSMWRWGAGKPGWNEMVDAYEGVRSFDIGNPDLAVALDHTTGHNERGYSEHSRTFLDGALAYLVHLKGRHVLTIGFSLVAGRRLLLQQVQATSRTGNRFLYKLPADLIGHVIDRLQAAFPAHQVLVADGSDLMGITIESYRRGLESETEALDRAERALARDPGDEWAARRLESATRDRAEFERRIAHAVADRPRIKALYRSSRRHALGKALKLNGVRHYAVLPACGESLAA